MIKITLNGKPFSRENLESQIMESFAAQIREKLGSIRHPETGEFPTIAVTGSSLADMKIELEGSAELIAMAKQRLQGAASDDKNLEPETDSSTPALVSPSGPKVFLSYAFDDSSLAERIANSLISNGIDTWWAGWCIGSGDSIRGERQLSWPVDDNYLGRFVT